MTNKDAERWARVVRSIGPDAEGWRISRDDLEALRRIEMTLHRWAERECNGEVEVDENGVAHATFKDSESGREREQVPNREAGALRRLASILTSYPHLRAYHQTDPRGCALYLYRVDDMGDRDPDAYYNSCGVAICR